MPPRRSRITAANAPATSTGGGVWDDTPAVSTVTRRPPYDPQAHGCRCDRCVLGPNGPVYDEETWRPTPPELRPDKAKILIVGIAPGANEYEDGRPFVGESGRFLDAALEVIGRRRADCSLTNCWLCFPPNNDVDAVNELAARVKKLRPIDACGGVERLLAEAAGAKVIVPMGALPLRHLTRLQGIQKYRGSPTRIGAGAPFVRPKGISKNKPGTKQKGGSNGHG